MKTVGEVRRENLERLIKEFGTMAAVAERGGTSSVYLSQVRNRSKNVGRAREMGSDMARRLEDGCGKPSGWMDQATHATSEPSRKREELAASTEGSSARPASAPYSPEVELQDGRDPMQSLPTVGATMKHLHALLESLSTEARTGVAFLVTRSISHPELIDQLADTADAMFAASQTKLATEIGLRAFRSEGRDPVETGPAPLSEK